MAQQSKRTMASIFLGLVRGLLTIAFILYITYTLGLAIYKNYQTNQKIDSLKKDIAALQDEISDLKNLIIYYQTDSFRELEARRKLGMKGKSEEIVILPKNETEARIIEQDTGELKVVPKDEEEPTPNFIKWWDYIFK